MEEKLEEIETSNKEQLSNEINPKKRRKRGKKKKKKNKDKEDDTTKQQEKKSTEITNDDDGTMEVNKTNRKRRRRRRHKRIPVRPLNDEQPTENAEESSDDDPIELLGKVKRRIYDEDGNVKEIEYYTQEELITYGFLRNKQKLFKSQGSYGVKAGELDAVDDQTKSQLDENVTYSCYVTLLPLTDTNIELFSTKCLFDLYDEGTFDLDTGQPVEDSGIIQPLEEEQQEESSNKQEANEEESEKYLQLLKEKMPLERAPLAGDLLAFKILHLNMITFQPEISDFQVFKVLSFDAAADTLEGTILYPPKEPELEELEDEEQLEDHVVDNSDPFAVQEQFSLSELIELHLLPAMQ